MTRMLSCSVKKPHIIPRSTPCEQSTGVEPMRGHAWFRGQIQWQIQWQKLAKTHHTKPLCNGLEASHVQYNSESHTKTWLTCSLMFLPPRLSLIVNDSLFTCHHSSGSFYLSSFKWFSIGMLQICKCCCRRRKMSIRVKS